MAFYAKTSTVGRNKIAAFATGGPAVNITTFAVGDANGVYYEPTGEEAALVHEVWRGNVNRVYTHPNHADWIVIEAHIPANQGGFDIREAIAIDAAGAVIAVAKYPLTNKPAPGSGAEKDLYVRLIARVADTSAITQLIDPSLIMATQDYVDTRMPRMVRAAASGNVNLAGLQTIDGVVLGANDRVLLPAQTDPAQNGVYVVQSGVWSRALDADNDLEVLESMLIIVASGGVNGDTVWMLSTDAPITVGTTALTFTKIVPDERNRTISDAAAPAGDTATPTTLFGWLGYMIKSITGKANWRTAPATTLEAAKGHMDRVDNPHNVPLAQVGGAAANHNHDAAYEPKNANIQTHIGSAAPHAGHVSHSLATAVNDFLVASAAGTFVKKTLAEVKTILSLGDAAYKNTGAAAGQVAAGNHGHGNDANIGGPYAASGHNHTGTYEPANVNIQSHIGTVGNPHGTTAAQVGASPAGHGHGNDANIGGPYVPGSKFNWAGQPGQPSWLWGSNDGAGYYVWNPSNFSVAYAASAGNADTLDGYHSGSFAGVGHGHGNDANIGGPYATAAQGAKADAAPYPRYESGLRIVRGTFLLNGANPPTITAGSGWTVARGLPGVYIVTYANPFSAVPSVTVGSEVTSVTALSGVSLYGVTFTVGGSDYSSRSINFIAIGPN